MVKPGLDAHVGHQLEGDVAPPLHLDHQHEESPRLKSHLGLLTVGKTGEDPDDVLAVGGFAGVGHDEELHDDVVDVPGGSLNDVNIFPPYTLLRTRLTSLLSRRS